MNKIDTPRLDEIISRIEEALSEPYTGGISHKESWALLCAALIEIRGIISEVKR